MLQSEPLLFNALQSDPISSFSLSCRVLRLCCGVGSLGRRMCSFMWLWSAVRRASPARPACKACTHHRIGSVRLARQGHTHKIGSTRDESACFPRNSDTLNCTGKVPTEHPGGNTSLNPHRGKAGQVHSTHTQVWHTPGTGMTGKQLSYGLSLARPTWVGLLTWHAFQKLLLPSRVFLNIPEASSMCSRLLERLTTCCGTAP
jgi:hypothetical protein